jgi:hypothetical protein
MSALRVATLWALACVGCVKHEAPPPPAAGSAKKPRAEITVWADPSAAPQDDPNSFVLPTEPPKTLLVVERGGMTLGVIGLPKGLSSADTMTLLDKPILAAQANESPALDAMIAVSSGCLKDLEPVIKEYFFRWWKLVLVVGAPCQGKVTSPMGVTALVEVGRGRYVRLTFDRNTRAILRVEDSKTQLTDRR